MKIDELIALLNMEADEQEHYHENLACAENIRKAAETIKLLWEVVRDTNNSKYKMQFDEWIGKGEAE